MRNKELVTCSSYVQAAKPRRRSLRTLRQERRKVRQAIARWVELLARGESDSFDAVRRKVDWDSDLPSILVARVA